MNGRTLIGASILTIALALGAAGTANAGKGGVKGPPDSGGGGGVDLLDCGYIPGGDTCQAALDTLCYSTDSAAISTKIGGVLDGFKKKSDHDSLVSKVVGAAIKYDEGKDDQAAIKLADYLLKMDGFACDPDESKPKINCELQNTLTVQVIVAQGACPYVPSP